MSKRSDSFNEIILAHAPANVPVMLLMDNINMYRGNKRHQRLLKALDPSMWNFTVRGCIIPNCSGIEHLIETPETALDSQKMLSTLKSDDVFIGMSNLLIIIVQFLQCSWQTMTLLL